MTQSSSETGAACGETLTYQQDGREETLPIGAAAWYAWLEHAATFRFKSDQGSFTAHKTRAGNGRGGAYWRAYRRRHGRLASVYLGASANLTLERLQEAAKQLAHAAEAVSAQHEAPLLLSSLAASPEGSGDALLSTKLHVPRLPVQHIPRPHLVALLNQGTQRVLTLVAAPAGSGKTTLLMEWATSTTLPAAWLSLEAADNDPRRFLSYVIAALQRLDEHIGRTALSLLRTSRTRSLTPELISLVMICLTISRKMWRCSSTIII